MTIDDRSWLSARLDAIDARLERMDARGEAQRADIELRVRSLERWRMFATGLAAATGAALAWVAQLAQKLVP